MSKLRDFIEGAGEVAAVQETVLNALERIFTDGDYPAIEAAILAPGYEGWEGRAVQLLKGAVTERHAAMVSEIELISARYKSAIPYPGQTAEYWVDTYKQPHLRVYWCLKCGHKQTSMALSGICCHGQPECVRCHHQVHEPTCARKKTEAP